MVLQRPVLAGVALLAALLMTSGGVYAQNGPSATPASARGSEVWAATLQVGDSGGLLGYGTLPESAAGALTTDAFSWRGDAYTVANVLYNPSPENAEAWNLLIDFSPALPERTESLALRVGDRWLNLADARGNDRQFLWYGVVLGWTSGSEVPVALREFPRKFEARSADGWGNNPQHPELGMAGTKLLRRAAVSYLYATSASAPPELPGPRAVSNIVSAQSVPTPNTALATDMVWQWGQFLDHDISFTPAGDPPEPLPISSPPGDPVFDPANTGQGSIPFNRSAFDPSTGTGPDNPREQVNAITAFIDASNVYGFGSRTHALRTNDGTGRLKTSADGRLLPRNEDGLENDGGSERRGLFVAGDVRANEQIGLTALHTLFMREHNRLAEVIAFGNPELNGHEVFEMVRKTVGAQMQVITYNEFLPLLLGPEAVGPYGGYDSGVDPTIANEFSTGAYRFGHTMLSPSLLRVGPLGVEGRVSLREAFFNPSLLAEQGISGFLRGLAHQRAQEVDAMLVDEVRNMLFGEPGGPGRDLAALNIQRGRDHGLPDYNIVRSAYGLTPAATFADVSSDPGVQDELSRAYGEVRYLDLWTGGLAEDHAPGAMVGETFHTIMADQFRRLRDGDRYWFQNDPYFLANPDLLAEVSATTLADVIRRNTPIGDEISDRVFGGPEPEPPPLPEISIDAGASPVTEGGMAEFTLRRTGDTEQELPVDVRVTETGATLSVLPASGRVATRRVVFQAGAAAATLTLETEDDAAMEDDSTVLAAVAEADGYEAAASAGFASVTIEDDDGEEVRLEAGWTSFEWPGIDRVGIVDALQGVAGGEVSSKISALYEWDEAAQRWLVFFPGQEDGYGLNTLTTFRQGHTYWAAVIEPVAWIVPEG